MGVHPLVVAVATAAASSYVDAAGHEMTESIEEEDSSATTAGHPAAVPLKHPAKNEPLRVPFAKPSTIVAVPPATRYVGAAAA